MKIVLLFVLKTYKKALSPILEVYLGKSCKFRPTCSEYAHEAIYTHGILRGTYLAAKRVVRCNRFLVSEVFDPVPKTASN